MVGVQGEWPVIWEGLIQAQSTWGLVLSMGELMAQELGTIVDSEGKAGMQGVKKMPHSYQDGDKMGDKTRGSKEDWYCAAKGTGLQYVSEPLAKAGEARSPSVQWV